MLLRLLKRTRVNKHLSDEELKAFEDPLWTELFRQCAAEKIKKLDDELLARESEHRALQAKDEETFRRDLRESMMKFFRKEISKEKLPWTPFTTPQNAPGSFNLDSLKSIPIDSFYAFLKPRETEARVSALCPFHEENTPSFVLFKEKNNFYCFGCGEHGSAIDFVMKWHRVPFKEACRWLAQKSTKDVIVDNSIDKK
jgi:hypothetical protein